VGHILLVISAIPGVIEHRDGALACFLVAIIIMGVGTGGFKANISPLVAEQYKRTKKFVGTYRNGETVVFDPALTTARIYMVRALLAYYYIFS
jgi:proton-dependent oligopeptide transporter, POT family